MIKILFVWLTLQLSFTAMAGKVQVLDPKVNFQAVHRIGPHIVASGTQGAIYQSTNNGLSWSKIPGPRNSQNLQFRDIQLLASGELTVMSAGEGEASRIYRRNTQNQWQRQAMGENPSTFYDCLVFINPQIGWLYGDSDQQGLFVLKTQDGGKNWHRQKLEIKAQAGEGGFASSGTCLNKDHNNHIYIGTGNGNAPRVLIYNNTQWQSLASPFAGGEAAGIFSVQPTKHWLYAFGGSLKTPNEPATAMRYNLSEKSWHPLPQVPLKGAVYGSAIIKQGGQTKVLISNPQGVAMWQQGQKTWQQLSQNNIWSLACDDKLGCVGVGKNGLVEVFSFISEQ